MHYCACDAITLRIPRSLLCNGNTNAVRGQRQDLKVCCNNEHGLLRLVATLKYKNNNQGNETLKEIPCGQILSPKNRQTRGNSASKSKVLVRL
jgi:hypothetical protein